MWSSPTRKIRLVGETRKSFKNFKQRNHPAPEANGQPSMDEVGQDIVGSRSLRH